MGKNSAIAWTDHTFNPWVGCTKVSPGCKHCYAEALAKRSPALVHGRPQVSLPVWGDEAPRRVTSAGYWKQPLFWDGAAAKAGKRARVFCASLADVFEDVTGSPVNDSNTMQEWRSRLWGLIEQTPQLDWLLLTKRPQNVRRMVPWPWAWQADAWPRNVWIGCTVEDQERARERLPQLLQVPAPVRFVSYEPALEAVDFGQWLAQRWRCARCGLEAHRERLGSRLGKLECPSCLQQGWVDQLRRLPGIDWLIVGGESGAHARPFDIAWARRAVAQGRAAEVPVFVKQLGEHVIGQTGVRLGGYLSRAAADPSEWPEDLRVQEFPKVGRQP